MPSDPFAGYDQWLVRPDQERIAEHDAYIDWCETNDLDPDDEDSREAWDRHIEETL